MKFKKFLLLIGFTLLFSQNSYADELSTWAVKDFTEMSRTGLINPELLQNEMNDKITRKEFCRLVMNVYNNVEKIHVVSKDTTIFKDTDDLSVIKAYKAGIVNGKEERNFAPDDFITRQEMAVMLSRMLNKSSENYIMFTNQIKIYDQKFTDSDQTSDWAINDMSAICYYNIITGVSETTVEPYSYATREQAICMLNRINKEFIPNDTEYSLPEIEVINKKVSTENEINIKWRTVSDAKSYNVLIKRTGFEPVVLEFPARVRSLEDYKLETNDFKYTIYVEAVINDEMSVISSPLEIDTLKIEDKTTIVNADDEKKVVEKGGEEDEEEIPEEVKEEKPTPPKPQEENEEEVENTPPQISYEGKELTLEEKETRVFPTGVAFESYEEAMENMVVVEVPVWRLNTDGSKAQSKKHITVNKALADDVVNIFTEIFNDSSKFPIKDVGGFSWRNTAGGKISQHSYGTCIDINYNENYYVTPDGTPITGTHWSPGVDPYSIAEDSIVVKIFAKYGWLWGGNAWGEGYNKDYMHFTYLGK